MKKIIAAALASIAVYASALEIDFFNEEDDTPKNRELSEVAAQRAVEDGTCTEVDRVWMYSNEQMTDFTAYCKRKSIFSKKFNGAGSYRLSDLTNEWITSVSEDRITGEKINYAESPWSASETPISRPYTGRKSMLAVSKQGKNTWSYVAFSDSMIVGGGDWQNGRNIYTLRANIDGKATTIQFVQNDEKTALFPVNESLFLGILTSANNIKLEVPTLNGNNAYFTYSLKGSTKAIQSL